MDVAVVARFLSILYQMNRRERWSRGRLEAHQAAALRRLRAYAYAHSPFYERFHRGLMDRPLHELPVLTKAMVMEEFDALVTDRSIRLADIREHVAGGGAGVPFRGRYRINQTSGTTGAPALFLYDRGEWLVVHASYARCYFLSGPREKLKRDTRVVSITSTRPGHLSAQTASAWSSGRVRVQRLNASDPLPGLVEQLNAISPEILMLYSSSARMLVEEQLAGRLRIAPRLVFTSASVLTEETRQRIEAAWGRQPFDNYGTTETGTLAGECTAHQGLHLFEDLVILESVDEQYRPVPPGINGAKVLVTRLYGRTQPLIRYELTDGLRLAEKPCPCGRPFALIEAIQGRTSEVIFFQAQGGGRTAVRASAFAHILDRLSINSWQVAQEPDALVIRVAGVPEGFDTKPLAETVRQRLERDGAWVPDLRVECVTEIPRDASGKVRRILRAPSNESTPAPAGSGTPQ